jgi:hypothetical protein
MNENERMQAVIADLLQTLTVADILTAYSGKPGCMCGCNGTYNVTELSRTEASEKRGYSYDDEDVSTSRVYCVHLNKAAVAKLSELS